MARKRSPLRPRRRAHWISNQRAEVAAGIGLFLAGAVLLHDAYDGRGADQPKLLRPFSFW
jgi:hypothetical protein